MIRTLLILILLTSFSTFSTEVNERYNEKKSVAEVINFIQNNFSYICGIKKVTKKKVSLRCETNNSLSFVTIKKNPREKDILKSIKEMKISFLNSDDAEFSITGAWESLQSSFSYVCGTSKVKKTIFGKRKVRYNCNVQGLGEVLVDLKIDMSNQDDSRYEDLSIIFKN